MAKLTLFFIVLFLAIVNASVRIGIEKTRRNPENTNAYFQAMRLRQSGQHPLRQTRWSHLKSIDQRSVPQVPLWNVDDEV
jgi:hypothetical protein